MSIPTIVFAPQLRADITEVYDLLEPLVRGNWQNAAATAEIQHHLTRAMDEVFQARMLVDELVDPV